MKDTLVAFRKELSIFIMVVFLILMDFLKIDDTVLKQVLLGLIGALTIHAGVMNNPWVNSTGGSTDDTVPSKEEPKSPPH